MAKHARKAYTSFTGAWPEGMSSDATIQFSLINGKPLVTIGGIPQTIENGKWTLSHERTNANKGDKIVAEVPIEDNFLPFQLPPFLNKYDCIYVIDTGFRQVRGENCYLTACMMFTPLNRLPEEGGNYNAVCRFAICKVFQATTRDLRITAGSMLFMHLNASLSQLKDPQR